MAALTLAPEAAPARPLIALFGPTASGKTALALALATQFGAEILSCDSVCVYRGMDVGTAKPGAAERAQIPHHLIDLNDPDQACTAGDYARAARSVLADLAARGKLPIVAGGSGLYLRALLDGLAPAPIADPALRALLRARAAARGPDHLHRTLARLDPLAAARIHQNDLPKMIRAIEVSLLARRPITEQWSDGRDALFGYRVLRLGLDPPRAMLYERINARAKAMFAAGLVEETRSLVARFGADCRPLHSLGYAEAQAVLACTLTEAEAIEKAQQGHRNYAKRQMTWFRREAALHPVDWLDGMGDTRAIQQQAIELVSQHVG